MKQMVFMLASLLFGLIGGAMHPIYALIPYYVFTTLQPQYLWAWALPSDTRWSLFAACIAFLSLLMHWQRVFAKLRWNSIATLLLVYTILQTFSCIGADNVDIAWEWLEVTVKILLMAMTTLLVADSLDKLKVMAVVIAASLGYLAWHFNSLYFFEGRMDILMVGLGACDNNGVGALMGMGLPFVYLKAKNSKRTQTKLCWAVVGALMVHAIMLTYSRGTMLAAIVGGAWLMWHHRPRMHAAVLVAVIVICISVMAGKEVRQRFSTVFNEHHDDSVQARFDSWGAAWAMICDRPLTGVGLRNSNLYTFSYGADRQGRTIHNTYLQIAADSGVPSVAVFIAMQVITLTSLGRTRRRIEAFCREHEDSKDKPKKGVRAMDDATFDSFVAGRDLALAIQTSLIIFGVHACFFSSEMFELQWLVIALAGAMPRLAEEAMERAERPEEPEPALLKGFRHQVPA